MNGNYVLGRSNDLDKDLVFGHAAEPSDHEFPKPLKNSRAKIEGRWIQKTRKTYLTVINLLKNFPHEVLETPS